MERDLANLGETSSLWLETAEEWGEDWRAALKICAASFMHSAPFKRSHPDPVKRRKFLHLYFKHLYETEWSDGRASLTCLKMKRGESEKVKILYVCCHQIFERRTEGDLAPLREIDEIGFDVCFRQDEWMDKMIHGPMKKAARELQTSLIYTPFHAVAEEYLNHGLGRRYAEKILEENCRRFVKRLSEEKKLIENLRQPPIVYGIADDIKIRQFQKDINYLELVHLHYNYIPGLKCGDDADYHRGEETSCTFVNVWGPCLKVYTAPVIKKHFRTTSLL